MNVRPNVLHFIDSFHQGGSERQAVQLVRLLHKGNQYRTHVACLKGDGVLRGEVVELGVGEIPEYRLTSFYDRNAVRQLRRCARMLRDREIDVVHTHDFYTNIFGMAAARLAGVPVRIASRRETLGMHNKPQKLVERSAYRLAQAVVANAEAVRQQLIVEGVPAEKVFVVHNGLDLERVRPQRAERDEILALLRLPVARQRRLVTAVANLRHPVKDHPMFLRAAQRVRAAVPQAAFVIAGEGELLEPLRNLASQLGLANDVFFIGRCQNVAELLAVSDVCVLSSKAEGFSNSLLEYMAAARPVVATDVGGARETVAEGETGHLVKSGDDETMAERLIALLNDPVRARAMGERGRQVVEQNFSCQTQLGRTMNLYEKLLAKASALPRGVESVGPQGV
jgi:glycosyltransferase involved in cell wall biosynthesis